MEKWEKKFINENLPELIKLIKCNALLLAYLGKYGALSPEEMENVNTIQGGNVNKASALILILQTRESAFGHLVKALQKCTQTGAFSILLKGIQRQLILRDVYFDGERLPLKNICKPIDQEILLNIIASEVDADTYEEFVNSAPWTLARETVPKGLPYYIPRTLSINTEIDPEIFKKLENDIFCIEGAELHHLSNLAIGKGKNKKTETSPPDSSRNQRNAVTTRFIVLERPDHFPDIVAKAKKPVYWIQFKDGKYWYVKSSPGSEVKNVSKFSVSKGVRNVSEEEFIERCVSVPGNEPVFIYDSPGMGKSVLLAELARKMKERRQEDSVIYFEISELVRKVREVDENCSCAAVRQTLVDCVAVSGLGRRIMRNLLDSRGHQIRLFLDGYDEVSQTDRPHAHKILNNLVKDGENIRIFVATRPHKKVELEERFGVLGYNIMPFDDSSKLAYFLKYWKSEHDVQITDGVKEFAKKCLKTLTFEMSDGEGDIAGIPLQCRMLAEIFAEDAKKGALIPTESQFQLNSIFQVYKHFIDKKFSTFCTDAKRQAYYDFHGRESIRTLFPETCKYLHEEAPIPDPDLIYRIGILEPLKSDSSKQTFSHRTMAEYFAAEFLATSTTSMQPMNATETDFFIELFFRQALMEYSDSFLPRTDFQNPVLCRFLDFFLSTLLFPRQDFGPVKRALRESDMYNSKKLIRLLCSCLEIDAVHLYLFLLKLYIDLDGFRDNPASLLRFKQDSPDAGNCKQTRNAELVNCLKEMNNFPYLVSIAAKCSSLNLVMLSCDLLKSVTDKEVHEFQYPKDESPMYHALERGHYQIFEYLLSFDKEQYYEMPLLHWCVRWSYCRPIVGDRLQIVKRILEERPDLLTKPHPIRNEVPLLAEGGHLCVLKILIEAGADLTQTNELKGNIAHLSAKYFSAEEYHKIVEIIISRNAQILFKQRHAWGCTPVHIALERIDLKSETLELLANKCNVTFNKSSEDGSELAVAIRWERSSRVIKDIIRLGGKKKKLDREARELLARNYNM